MRFVYLPMLPKIKLNRSCFMRDNCAILLFTDSIFEKVTYSLLFHWNVELMHTNTSIQRIMSRSQWLTTSVHNKCPVGHIFHSNAMPWFVNLSIFWAAVYFARMHQHEIENDLKRKRNWKPNDFLTLNGSFSLTAGTVNMLYLCVSTSSYCIPIGLYGIHCLYS